VLSELIGNCSWCQNAGG